MEIRTSQKILIYIAFFQASVPKLISGFVNDKKAVFPTDIILSSLLAACPATMLTVLLLFSSGLTSDDVICSSRKLGLQTNSVNGDTALSYSQGLADFQFMNAYCHQNLVDFAGLFSFYPQVPRLNFSHESNHVTVIIFSE